MSVQTLVTHKLFIGALAVVVLAGGAWIYISKSAPSYGATMIVHSAEFTQEITVSGTVQAAHSVDLGFAQSGRVSHVYAAVGDPVKAGQTIAEIDNGDLRAAVVQAQATLDAAQAQLDSLKNGTRPEQIAVTQTQIDSDNAAIAQANQSIVNAIQSAYTYSDDAIHNKVDQFFNNPRSTTPTLTFQASNSQLQTALQNERTSVDPMLSSWQSESAGLTPASDLSSAAAMAQQNLAVISELLSGANAALNTAIPTSATTQATINGYAASVATARGNVNAAQSALTSALTALQTAQASLAKDQKNLSLQQAGSTSTDIAAQEAQVAAAQAALQVAQAQLAKTIVVAPFDGTITRMDAKVGEVVAPTNPQISMISNGLFQIVSYVPEVEIAGVQIGNSATTTLDAYGPQTFFTAKVIAIDPAETVVNGVSTYKTTLQFDAADPRIKSGMTASVDITTASVPNTIAIPLGAIFQKNGAQVVQVVRGNQLVDVPITTGVSTELGNVQITSGLYDGDMIVLSPDSSQ